MLFDWRFLALAFLLGLILGRLSVNRNPPPHEPLLRSDPRSIKRAIYNPRGFRSRD